MRSLPRDPLFPQSAPAVFLGQRALFAFSFALWSTYAVVRRVTDLGFDPLELILVGTVLEASAFLAEIPTGVVADLYGRRRSVVIGYAVMGAGFLFEAASTSFIAVLLAQVVWGVGSTFLSGARSAWLADEIGEQAAVPVYLRASQSSQGGALVGLALAAVLASHALVWPMVAGALGLIVLAAALPLVMTERGFSPLPTDERETFAAMVHTFRAGLGQARRSPVVLVLLVLGLLGGAWSESLDRLREFHILATVGGSLPALGPLPAVTWWALISGASLVLGILVVGRLRRHLSSERLAQLPRLLAILEALLLLGAVAFALAGSFGAALAAWLGLTAARTAMGPLQTAWANQGLDSRVRATVLSMLGQADALGQVVGGPVIGGIGRVFGVRTALLGATALLVPNILLLARVARRTGAADAEKASGD